MKLLEIQRQLKKRRKFYEGQYVINVNLDNPGDEFQEFLRVRITENGQTVAKAVFKQWSNKGRWEPLSIDIRQPNKKKSLNEMIRDAATQAGFLLKD